LEGTQEINVLLYIVRQYQSHTKKAGALLQDQQQARVFSTSEHRIALFNSPGIQKRLMKNRG